MDWVLRMGSAPQLGSVEAMTYAAACTSRLRLGCAVFSHRLGFASPAVTTALKRLGITWAVDRRPGASPVLQGGVSRGPAVARLLLAGQSSQQIASALSLSPHTVNDHVGAIEVKAGVHSRAELAAVFTGQPAG
jgi:DNA-binding NarL/FixJ family response regulator